MKLSWFILVTIIATSVYAGDVTFENCGNDEVKRVQIDGCNSTPPCKLLRNRNVSIEVDFVASENAASATASLCAKFGPFWHYITLEDPKVCDSVKCPIIAGQSYSYKLNQFLPDSTPSVAVTVELQLNSDSDSAVLACAKLDVEID